jgi:hypothetical protein
MTKAIGYSLNFSSIFGHLFHFWKSGQKWPKSKAVALTFRPLLATYFIFEKVAKNGQKIRLYIALTFRPFLATYCIFEKVAKNDQKVRL